VIVRVRCRCAFALPIGLACAVPESYQLFLCVSHSSLLVSSSSSSSSRKQEQQEHRTAKSRARCLSRRVCAGPTAWSGPRPTVSKEPTPPAAVFADEVGGKEGRGEKTVMRSSLFVSVCLSLLMCLPVYPAGSFRRTENGAAVYDLILLSRVSGERTDRGGMSVHSVH
jgi:hypothetical protein